MPESPRDIAVSALLDRSGNVSAHLDRLLAEADLSGLDKALARELALGAVRRKGTLEAVLSAFLKSPGQALPGPVRQALHVGLYQILFLERVPAFAAVNEAVEQVSRFHHRSKAGLVNGLLRSVAREVSPVLEGKPPHAPDVLPLGPATYRQVARAIFPDPAAEPAAYLAAAMSLPPALARRWLERAGSLEAAMALAVHSNTRAPLILRVNRLKADLETAAAALAGDGVRTAPHANGRSLVVEGWVNVRELAAFRDGLIQPQDPSASAVIDAAAPQPGMNVLDFCAAPGAKTTLLAELMRNEGRIVATDVSPDRLARIDDNCRRMGIAIVTTLLADKVGSLTAQSFDLALADVPCSNTGVLARRAEARWRFDETRLAALAADQRTLLSMAAQFVRPGGTVVYSTCSVEPEENAQVARWAVQQARRGSGPAALQLVREELTLPAGADDPRQWHDGGYFAVFRVR